MDRLSQLLAGLPHRARLARAELPQRWQAWRDALREDPTVFWRTGLVQLGIFILAVLLLLAGAQWLIAAFAPAGDKTFVEPTPTSVLYVACTAPGCLRPATVTRPMNFKDWPITCEQCNQRTVYRAARCSSCNHWFATTPRDTSVSQTHTHPSETNPACPHCARRNAAKPAPAANVPQAADDAEDPW